MPWVLTQSDAFHTIRPSLFNWIDEPLSAKRKKENQLDFAEGKVKLIEKKTKLQSWWETYLNHDVHGVDCDGLYRRENALPISWASFDLKSNRKIGITLQFPKFPHSLLVSKFFLSPLWTVFLRGPTTYWSGVLRISMNRLYFLKLSLSLPINCLGSVCMTREVLV